MSDAALDGPILLPQYRDSFSNRVVVRKKNGAKSSQDKWIMRIGSSIGNEMVEIGKENKSIFHAVSKPSYRLLKTKESRSI